MRFCKNSNNNIRRISNNKDTATKNNNINAHRQQKMIKGVNPRYIMEHLKQTKTNTTDEADGGHCTPGGTLRTPLPPSLVS